MLPNQQFAADLVTFTEEVLDAKNCFLYYLDALIAKGLKKYHFNFIKTDTSTQFFSNFFFKVALFKILKNFPQNILLNI